MAWFPREKRPEFSTGNISGFIFSQWAGQHFPWEKSTVLFLVGRFSRFLIRKVYGFHFVTKPDGLSSGNNQCFHFYLGKIHCFTFNE